MRMSLWTVCCTRTRTGFLSTNNLPAPETPTRLGIPLTGDRPRFGSISPITYMMPIPPRREKGRPIARADTVRLTIRARRGCRDRERATCSVYTDFGVALECGESAYPVLNQKLRCCDRCSSPTAASEPPLRTRTRKRSEVDMLAGDNDDRSAGSSSNGCTESLGGLARKSRRFDNVVENAKSQNDTTHPNESMPNESFGGEPTM